MITEFITRLRYLFVRNKREELDRELQSHLELSTQAKIAQGLSQAEAKRQALIEFGGFEAARVQCGEQRPGWWIGTVIQDLKFALRGFRRNPAFSITVVLTLMLGIGSTSAVFSVVDRILFRPLPYLDSARLVSVGLVAPIEPQEFMLGGSYYEWQDHQKPFVAMTSETGVEPCDLNEVNPVRLDCASVESNFLPTMGVTPVVGRNFLPNEDRPNAAKVALISFALWHTRFHGDPSIVGKIIKIDGSSTQVIGVLPASFEMPRLQPADVIVPEALDVGYERRANPGRPMWAFARLKPGIVPEQAKAQLEPLFEYSLEQAPPQFRKEVHYVVRPLRDRQFHDVHQAAWILFGLVMAVLLIACANVASLFTARRAAREREMAVRAALGAGRIRLFQQAIIESLALSVTGALAGVLFAALLLHVFILVAPAGMPFLNAAKVDSRVLAFTLFASVLCALCFGLATGLSQARAETLTGRNSLGIRHARLRQVLVATQIAACLVLLAGGMLLARSFRNLETQRLGMNYEDVLTATVSLGQSAYPNQARQMAFFQQLMDNLRWQPGVIDVAVSDSVPPGGAHHDQIYASLRVEGQPRFAGGTGGNVAWRSVTPDYFRAFGIPLIEGSGFTAQDQTSSNRFIVLSRSLADRMFPGQIPLGRQVHLANGAPADQDPPFTVVGVAADVKNGGLAAGEEPEYYRLCRNRAEDWSRGGVVIVRSNLPAATMKNWLRTQIAALDPTLPVEIATLDERVAKLADQPRFEMLLVGYFACAGLMLSVIGLYGVISFLTVQRKPEVGIRMALGARRSHIVCLVLVGVARMVMPGIFVGLVLAFALSRAMSGLLFNIGPRDPITYIGATIILATVAAAASMVPAIDAALVDPIATLRQE
ncbi:MAG TPA: ABC transporter permease [Terracidiphilus sp.]|nr:ABC transporter permease [Terracidiphilus sp.]